MHQVVQSNLVLWALANIELTSSLNVTLKHEVNKTQLSLANVKFGHIKRSAQDLLGAMTTYGADLPASLVAIVQRQSTLISAREENVLREFFAEAKEALREIKNYPFLSRLLETRNPKQFEKLQKLAPT